MDCSLLEHMRRYIGENVTIFTTSGGASGCGFSGILLVVGPCFVRLVNRLATPPANPLSETICGDRNGDSEPCPGSYKGGKEYNHFTLGSVCDIPVDRIAAFCHNAV